MRGEVDLISDNETPVLCVGKHASVCWPCRAHLAVGAGRVQCQRAKTHQKRASKKKKIFLSPFLKSCCFYLRPHFWSYSHK